MNIAIVGAGLLGRVVALNLINRGHTITIFEKDSKEGVTVLQGLQLLEWLAPICRA